MPPALSREEFEAMLRSEPRWVDLLDDESSDESYRPPAPEPVAVQEVEVAITPPVPTPKKTYKNSTGLTILMGLVMSLA
jgi:hypothetical protein